ncbi:MAG: dockerin type I repeat-containing protein [Candidatus Zixiibacteriota bacterium]
MRVRQRRDEAICSPWQRFTIQLLVPQKLGWGGGRTQSFLFIFTFLILLLTPLNSTYSQTLQLLLEKSSISWYQSPVVADADNDGQNEVLSGSLMQWETNGNGCEVFKYDWGNCYGQAYCPTWKAGIPIEQSLEVRIAVGNLDSDPDNELVIANTSPHDINSNGRLTIWKHTGGDNYDSCWSMTVGEGIGDLAIGDVDHDGQNELVVSYNYYWRGFKIFERVGECQYAESFSYVTGKDNYSVTIADCDNDDSLEIVLTKSIWGTSVCVWEYRSGSYQEVWSYDFDTGSPYTLGAQAQVGDTDNDGENEILVAVHGSGTIANRGIYVFEHTVGDSYELDWSETGSDKESYSPFIADILNDGDNEFLVLRYDQLLVYSYTCSGYDTVVVKQLPDSSYYSYVGDSDNDGKNEVIVSGKTLQAYEGLISNTHPNSYFLLSPLNSDSVKTPVTLTWQPSIDPDPDDTVRYNLFLSRSIVFNPDSTVVYDCLLDTTFTFTDSLKTWYWKVKAYDKWGAVRWSDQTWSFYVYLCGDCNGDGKISVSDVICEINYLFKGGSAPVPLVAGDVNCDGKETVSDVVYKINYLFKGGPEPCKDCP